jgi:hypothetical protein
VRIVEQLFCRFALDAGANGRPDRAMRATRTWCMVFVDRAIAAHSAPASPARGAGMSTSSWCSGDATGAASGRTRRLHEVVDLCRFSK